MLLLTSPFFFCGFSPYAVNAPPAKKPPAKTNTNNSNNNNNNNNNNNGKGGKNDGKSDKKDKPEEEEKPKFDGSG